MAFKPPSSDELNLVQILKERVQELPYNFSDIEILRFLRGRKLILDDAYRSMEKHAAWRKEKEVESITEEDVINEHQKRKSVIHGYDKSGKPILYVFARRHNAYERDIVEIEKYIIYMIELVISKTIPTEQRFNLIFDLNGFSYSCMDYEAVKVLISTLQLNYPDTLGNAYIINNPWIFSACWAIIRAWIDPVTSDKVQFITMDGLEELVDTEHIPEDLHEEL